MPETLEVLNVSAGCNVKVGRLDLDSHAQQPKSGRALPVCRHPL